MPWASSGLWRIAAPAHGPGIGMDRCWCGPNAKCVVAACGAEVGDGEGAEDEEEVTATRSHDGHMVRVVGGFICM